MDPHSPPALRDHAHALAKAFNVRLLEGVNLKATPEEAVAIPDHRVVLVAPITDESTYAIALHEMGHIVHPCGDLRGSRALQRDAEDAAWAWARHYARVWTPFMEQIATWARRSYDEPPPQPPAPDAPIRQQIDWESWK